ncbi:CheW-like domain protein [compost metagenome]
MAVFALAGDRAVAVPVDTVIETMRPLPVEPLAGLPPWVEGVALIRGRPTPVLNVAALLGESGQASLGAFVTVRAERCALALAVRRVTGVGSLEPGEWQALPSIAAGVTEAVEAVGVLGARLTTVLSASRLIPDEAMARIEAELGRHGRPGR